jgi:hypothetical protein
MNPRDLPNGDISRLVLTRGQYDLMLENEPTKLQEIVKRAKRTVWSIVGVTYIFN